MKKITFWEIFVIIFIIFSLISFISQAILLNNETIGIEEAYRILKSSYFSLLKGVIIASVLYIIKLKNRK